MNTDKTPLERAKAMLATLSLEEKLHQLTAQLLLDVDDSYERKRDHLCGNYRNPGHFMHQNGQISTPGEVARRINRDMEMSIAAQPHGIPPLEHGESLHGAQWGMASIFPQPIGMASTFDPELVAEAADVIGKETAVVGVRQALAPVVNLSRDVRWGRTIETFGEDPKLASDMGVALCRGFQKNGVVATPKHFVDNYGDGGRDSNHSSHSERELREVYLKPFEACFHEGGAMGVMAAYNSLSNGLPAHANPWLLTKLLREEWGFEGIVVSDYGGVDGVAGAHRLAGDLPEALALCLEAGLDITLAGLNYRDIREAYDRGLLKEEVVDRSVLRLLTVKFALGLFDKPFVDPDAADRLVRCDAHKAVAIEAAKKSLVLLENRGSLPFDGKRIRTLGIFGPGADCLPTGKNYSGPYAHLWEAPDVLSPLAYFRAHAKGIEIVTGSDDMIPVLAPRCDAALYFTAVVEGEGLDRSDLKLPSYRAAVSKNEAAVIVDKAEHLIEVDQEASISALAAANGNTVVVLMNGAPVDVTAWHAKVGAILEAWYPGEGGSEAIFSALFGGYNPGGKLPVTWMKHVGQLPLFYAYKPSGRGYGYENDDGKPLFPFGYGLSYTTFEIKNVSLCGTANGWTVSTEIKNTGAYDGDEVIQVYLHAERTKVVRPAKELVAYKRTQVKKGETVRVEIPVPGTVTSYYDADMNFGAHGGVFTLLVATSSDDADVKAKLPLSLKG
ncbi:MAG: glycoside hydrolase family 3 C-terminal domain-containing protein [Clostridia bacterium]|nr:glycoside hydrolase family 3 C-terminal domain-containing protein [Clostridia bacterium]